MIHRCVEVTKVLSIFPKILDDFENSPNTVQRLFLIMPKMTENFRGRSEDVLIVDQHLLASLIFNKGKPNRY